MQISFIIKAAIKGKVSKHPSHCNVVPIEYFSSFPLAEFQRCCQL